MDSLTCLALGVRAEELGLVMRLMSCQLRADRGRRLWRGSSAWIVNVRCLEALIQALRFSNLECQQGVLR